ncbi:MAG TPA: hypothetical protein VFZ77_17510 [Acidimicrobiales bacterium]
MPDVITGLTDDDIATEWRHEKASTSDDDDATDAPGQADDADGVDTDDDTTDRDADQTDS